MYREIAGLSYEPLTASIFEHIIWYHQEHLGISLDPQEEWIREKAEQAAHRFAHVTRVFGQQNFRSFLLNVVGSTIPTEWDGNWPPRQTGPKPKKFKHCPAA